MRTAAAAAVAAAASEDTDAIPTCGALLSNGRCAGSPGNALVGSMTPAPKPAPNGKPVDFTFFSSVTSANTRLASPSLSMVQANSSAEGSSLLTRVRTTSASRLATCAGGRKPGPMGPLPPLTLSTSADDLLPVECVLPLVAADLPAKGIGCATPNGDRADGCAPTIGISMDGCVAPMDIRAGTWTLRVGIRTCCCALLIPAPTECWEMPAAKRAEGVVPLKVARAE